MSPGRFSFRAFLARGGGDASHAREVSDRIKQQRDAVVQLESALFDRRYETPAQARAAIRAAHTSWRESLDRLEELEILEIWTRGTLERLDEFASRREWERLWTDTLPQRGDRWKAITKELAKEQRVAAEAKEARRQAKRDAFLASGGQPMQVDGDTARRTRQRLERDRRESRPD